MFKAARNGAVPGSPPAVWTAFVEASAWKSWALLCQFAIMALMAVGIIRLARRPPDVVLVSADGTSTFVPASMADEALARFVAEQKQRPSDATVHHFVTDFLRLFLGVNSTTIETTWPEALARMTPSLRQRMEREGKSQRVLETLKAAQVRTQLEVDEVAITQKSEGAMYVKVAISRRKFGISGDQEAGTDKLVVELALVVVPRSMEFPDGLQVAEYQNRLVPPVDGSRHE
jgi:hypothetical protein